MKCFHQHHNLCENIFQVMRAAYIDLFSDLAATSILIKVFVQDITSINNNPLAVQQTCLCIVLLRFE